MVMLGMLAASRALSLPSPPPRDAAVAYADQVLISASHPEFGCWIDEFVEVYPLDHDSFVVEVGDCTLFAHSSAHLHMMLERFARARIEMTKRECMVN